MLLCSLLSLVEALELSDLRPVSCESLLDLWHISAETLSHEEFNWAETTPGEWGSPITEEGYVWVRAPVVSSPLSLPVRLL